MAPESPTNAAVPARACTRCGKPEHGTVACISALGWNERAAGSVSIRLREDHRWPAHVQVSVFVGRNEGSRGHAGVITLRVDEWDELVERLDAPEDLHMCQPSWLLRVLPGLQAKPEPSQITGKAT